MIRVFLSTVIGVVLGIAGGLALGWGFPAEYSSSTLSELSTQHQDNYTLLVASGYVNDGDLRGAFERLQRLGVENVPEYVQDVTERFITNSRPLNEIQLMVALSEGFGRFTPLMESFCQLCMEDGENGQ